MEIIGINDYFHSLLRAKHGGITRYRIDLIKEKKIYIKLSFLKAGRSLLAELKRGKKTLAEKMYSGRKVPKDGFDLFKLFSDALDDAFDELAQARFKFSLLENDLC